MRLEHRCQQCRDLEQAHDRRMDEYFHLVDQQSRFHRRGQPLAARDLDAQIHRIKVQREAAIDALLCHRASHHVTS